jgi:hypothetical protein
VGVGALVFVLGILVWQGVARLVSWRRRHGAATADGPGSNSTVQTLQTSVADEAEEWLRQY